VNGRFRRFFGFDFGRVNIRLLFYDTLVSPLKM